MSVNLSMCMNVDVTAHDQLLNAAHVSARHSAAEQFRDDDPWARYGKDYFGCILQKY